MRNSLGRRIRYSRVLDKYAEGLANVRSIYRNSESKGFDTILINAYNELFLARTDLAAGNICSTRRACVRRAVKAVGEYLKMNRERGTVDGLVDGFGIANRCYSKDATRLETQCFFAK